MYYKIAQLILSPSGRSGPISDIIIAQPDSNKEQLAGKLFMVAEIGVAGSVSLKLLNYLSDTISNNYYQHEKIILRERSSLLKIDHIFEASLAKTNKEVMAYLENEKIARKNLVFNVTIGVLHEDKLYFSSTGSNKVLLIYESDKNGNKKYKVIDIVEQSRTGEQPADGGKLFSNVISGQIPKRGLFIISNEALPEYISNQQLIQISTTLPPASAVEQMKNILKNINSYVSFLGLIIKTTSLAPAQIKIQSRPETTTRSSISSLNRTEEETEHLLTPSGIINPGRWIKTGLNLLGMIKKIAPEQKRLMIKDKIFFKKNSPFRSAGKKLWLIIKNIFIYLINALFVIFKSASSFKRIKSLPGLLIIKLGNARDSLIARIQMLNRGGRVLLIIGFISIVLFSISLIYTRRQQNIVKKESEYQDIISAIEEKQNKAEAALLYSNEEGALGLFNEIKDLIGSLPQNTDEHKQKFEEFSLTFNQQLEELRRVFRPDDLKEISDFVNLITQANPQNIILAKSENKIYAADSDQKSIYIHDLNTNSATTLADLSARIDTLISPAINSNNTIYYLNGDAITAFSTDSDNLIRLGITLFDKPENINALDIFNDRLYLLAPLKNQVYRYNRLQNEFSGAYAWAAPSLDLAGAVDLSIDGSIYILKSDASALKLIRGEKDDEFSLEAIDPPLKSPTKIIAINEGQGLYVLEPENRRIVVYDKKGQFNLQYRLEDLNDIKDFSVDEEGAVAYILSGSKIFSFKLVHLENNQ